MAKHTTPRGFRDEADVGPDPKRARHLVPLRELGKFKVADGEPDIRGWTAFTSTGREIGRVDELLVDTDTNEVVMLDIDLRRDDRHTLAPLRAAWVDHATRRVVVGAQEIADADLPSFARGRAATDDDVRAFDDRYERAYGSYHADDDRELRVRHADAEELRFRRRADERAAAADAASTPADTASRSHFVERHRTEDASGYQVADRGEREVRFPRREERVVERRPLVEEVVVRQRDAADPADPGRRDERRP
jgi:hypothetical protein